MRHWLDERLDLSGLYRELLDRPEPRGTWWNTLGSATLFLFGVQCFTGVLLAVYYVPTPDHAYASVRYIMDGVAWGWLIRGVHHWGATLMIACVFLHLVRVFWTASYKYPRELTWISGSILFLLTLGMGFTGYLLPYDQKAYWATTVGTRIGGSVPGLGPWILRVLRGGAEVSALTLSRFFAAHVCLLPGVMALLVFLHLYLVVRHGESSYPEPGE